MEKEKEFKRLLERQPDAPEPWTKTKTDYRNSVHKVLEEDPDQNCEYRKEKARVEVSHPPVDREKVKQECEKFLDYFQIKGKVSFQKDPLKMDTKNVIWGKFTQDGYLGVIAHGPVNFQMPDDASKYDLKESNQYVYNTSGILVHWVGKHWNTDYILVCEIIDFPMGYTLVEIKRALANWILEAEIPIIDRYSHQVGDEKGERNGR